MSREYADPNCPDCGGLGFIYGESMLDPGHACHCVMDALKLQNMEQIWPSLSKSKEIPHLRKKPPLRDLVKHNVYVTARDADFRAHLKALAFTKGTMWDARVFSDKDLVTAWLRTAKAQGHKIYDSEIDNYKGKFVAMDIDELVEPFELVILKLGVKQAPNKETHSVLLEALTSRTHLGKPTWIVDQPDRPLMTEYHLAFSSVLEGMLSHWPHIRIKGPEVRVVSGPAVQDHDYDTVSDIDTDDLLEVPKTAAAKIDEALSNLDDDDDDDEGEEGDDEEEGVEEEEENDDGEGYEEEEENDDDEGEDESPTRNFLGTLNIESEEKPKRAKKGWGNKKKSWKKSR